MFSLSWIELLLEPAHIFHQLVSQRLQGFILTLNDLLQELGSLMPIPQWISHQLDFLAQIRFSFFKPIDFPVQLAYHVIFNRYPGKCLFLKSTVLFAQVFILELDCGLRALLLNFFYFESEHFVHVFQFDYSLLLSQDGLRAVTVFAANGVG